MSLLKLLKDELAERLPDQPYSDVIQEGNGELGLRFAARCPEVGDLTLWIDKYDDEVTVQIEHFGHQHFSDYGDDSLEARQARIVTNTVDFASALFADQVLLESRNEGRVTVWKGRWEDGPTAAMGVIAPRFSFFRKRKQEAVKRFVWSGPLVEQE